MVTDEWSDASTAEGGRSFAIEFRLDSRSGVPAYLQLVQQVEHAMRLGYLQKADQLPTVKGVVERLAINPNTVLKAYRELEHRGLTLSRPGQGTFISRSMPAVALAELARLRKRLLEWLRTAAAAGLDARGIEAMVDLTLREFLTQGLVAGESGGEFAAAESA